MENSNDQEKYRNEIYSKSVRAGKRTYFFDVKSTRSGDHYLTITESKKKFDQEGNFHFEKHKIFLYKEDFDKFKDGGMKTINNELDYGDILQFIFYINMLTWPFASVGWVSSLIQRAAASQKRINEFILSLIHI